MPRFRQILLALNRELGTHRAICRGVVRYVNVANRRWDLLADSGAIYGAADVRSLAKRNLDGAVGAIHWAASRSSRLRVPFPLVGVDAYGSHLTAAEVGLDHHAIGHLAGEYLLGLGFRHYAYSNFGSGSWAPEQARLEGFRQALSGANVDVYLPDPKQDPMAPDWPKALERWAEALPKPVGVFARHDGAAQRLRAACRHLELSVPEQMAILGVDDDDMLCEGARPALSSIRLPCEAIGYEAARILDEILDGRAPSATPRRFEPVDVHVRESTDTLAVGDLLVADALRFIRENACKPVTPADVAEEVLVSRQHLDVRFRKVLGRTVFKEIRRVQIERIRYLLRETDIVLSAIAPRTGFVDEAALSHAFRKATGQTPGAYRRSFRRI
jgi:LacI family transcriptional regulator, galactose operon repressor